jgi:hypothetical protein
MPDDPQVPLSAAALRRDWARIMRRARGSREAIFAIDAPAVVAAPRAPAR